MQIDQSLSVGAFRRVYGDSLDRVLTGLRTRRR